MLHHRPALLTDLPALNRISRASKAFWGYPADWLAHWEAGLQVDAEALITGTVIVAVDGSVPVGFGVLAERPACYEILHLWLLPAYIGQGHGQQLLAQLLAAGLRAPKPIRVEADPHAAGFYRRQGFVEVGQVESYPPGRWLPVMQRPAG